MIGEQPTGLVRGVFITATAHEGLSVTINGQPGRLAVLDEAGNVVAEGHEVAREAEAVAINNYRSMLKGIGHLTVMSKPLDADPAGAQQPAVPERARRHGDAR